MGRTTMRPAARAALLALAVTCGLALAKVIAWGVTGSLAVLSQALDSLVDIVGLGLVYLAVRIAAKPADASHHYGHAKAENLAAFTQTLLLGVVLMGVVIEAARRLSGAPPEIEARPLAIGLMALSAGVDVARVRFLTTIARAEQSAALQAGALNLAADVATALVALVSLLLVGIGLDEADAVGALVVSVLVAAAGVRLAKRSVDILMDRAPRARTKAIEAAATAAAGVAETRRVRVRGSESRLFADVTVAAGRTASLERAHDIAEAVESEIERVVPGADVVVHVEPASETSELVERALAAASRAQGVQEVHNVSVHAFDAGEGRQLRVALHAKVPPDLSLEEAHEISDAVEARVIDELGPGVRVDAHIEPLEPAASGRDVTAQRSDVVADVTRAALSEPEVIDCHEVLVTDTGGRLVVVAHVRGRADLPLASIHAASIRVEKAVQAARPEVASLLIHFEPWDGSAPAARAP